MLTNACKYAIRATLYLAQNSSEEKKLGVKVVADDLEVPLPFLAKLLQQLVKNSVISSTKGPHGGFYLSAKNLKNTVCDIIQIIDGPNVFEGCFMGLAKCDAENPCPVHFIVAPFKEKLLDKFLHKSIAEFSNEIQSQGRFISLKDLE